MDTPTLPLTDIAKILDAAIEREPPSEAAALLQRFLRRLPGVEGLQRPLLPEDPASPSLLDLAKLLVAVGSAATLPECRGTACWLIGRSPSGAGQLRQLDTMAKNAGWWPTLERSYAELLCLDQQYEALLAAEDWQDPADVLDLSRERGLDYDALFAIATAKLAQCQLAQCRGKEKEKRSRVMQRLERYAERNRTIETLDQKLDRLQALLKAQAIPASELAKLMRLIQLIERNHGAGQTTQAQP